MDKKKLDAIEAAVEERRQARDHLKARTVAATASKKQFDNDAAMETAATARLDRADRALEKAIKEVVSG